MRRAPGGGKGGGAKKGASSRLNLEVRQTPGGKHETYCLPHNWAFVESLKYKLPRGAGTEDVARGANKVTSWGKWSKFTAWLSSPKTPSQRGPSRVPGPTRRKVGWKALRVGGARARGARREKSVAGSRSASKGRLQHHHKSNFSQDKKQLSSLAFNESLHASRRREFTPPPRLETGVSDHGVDGNSRGTTHCECLMSQLLISRLEYRVPL